jgi:hypothetical protein
MSGDKKPRHGDVVEVEWDDAEHIQLGWDTVKAYVKAADHPHAYRSAGYWIEGSKKGRSVIALSLDPSNGGARDCMSIPSVAVTKVTVLGRSNKRTRKALG